MTVMRIPTVISPGYNLHKYFLGMVYGNVMNNIQGDIFELFKLG